MIGSPFADAFGILKDKKSVFFKNAFKRIFEEPDAVRINRVADLLQKLDIRFTFFVSGFLNKYHQSFIRELHAQGHEIASHGYFHRSYAKMSPREIALDLKRSKKAFAQLGIPIEGLRPPYMAYHESIYDIGASLDFKYISGSVCFDFPIYKNKTDSLRPFPLVDGAICEIPITVLTDFDLISYQGMSMKDAIRHWKEHSDADATFLFHSLFIGAKENIAIVEDFFRYLLDEYELTTMGRKVETGKDVALTMDIGVLSKMDLLRAFFLS